ncbi:5'-3' exoribonuclease 1 [Drosophila eugracilis]|uniref:5'-3' exoribonuclease 1 n=1 Tax=Drosophila eugracilis TaxID=29029 RepID=UPI0007E643D1|nr:5'-3' exoribonuclease 1 [Drosophila eugracilis]XP_017064852.1 5'-3' exoribonuclease 1 [Drosophila eugracilis]
MGVPKFFRYISERYPCLSELAREHSIPEFDNLYLDMNGIVHNCSHPDDNNIHFHLEEHQIFQEIFNYVDKLFYLIKPQRLFFLAVDGVAPRAKMNQQRSRRFRSAREAEQLETKAALRGEKREHERFDSNCITPGTEFMVRLQEGLRAFLKTKISTDPLWQRCSVILSGQETPGEGEHKIMDCIRYMKAQPDYDPNTRHCLYGLDADLIILGLCTHELHFVVLREEVKFGRNVKRASVEETRFFLLHLGLLREYLELEFDALSTPERKLDVAQLIDDWVLMGFMVGNDFIPHLPCLHISSNALPLLYRTYIRIYPTLGGNINENGKLNLRRLQIFMTALTEVEIEQFKEHADDLKYMNAKTEAFDIDVTEIAANENYDSDLGALINESMMLYEDDSDENGSDEEAILASEFKNYKRNYYRNKFKRESQSQLIEELGHHYVNALQWILDYYYRGVQSWDWYYPFHYAPFISDLKNIEQVQITFQLGKPFLPFQQLLAVLPSSSCKLLPTAYHDLMLLPSSPLAEFYPLEFESDLNGKKHDWEAVTLIPFIDEERLIAAMSRCEPLLSAAEKERNRHGPMYVYNYCIESQGPMAPHPPLRALTHLYCMEVPKWSSEIAINLPHSVCAELPNASRHVFFPGFPTMKHLPFDFELRQDRVKVFEQSSRNQSMVLKPRKRQLDTLEAVAGQYLEQVVHIGWPHLIKAKVVRVVTRDQRVDEEGISTYESRRFDSECKTLKEHFTTRMGIEFANFDVLVYVRTFSGSTTEFGAKGKLMERDAWSEAVTAYPAQGVVADLVVKENMRKQFNKVEEFFPAGSQVFFIGNPYYGSEGTVQDPLLAYTCGRIQVSIRVCPEPDVQEARALQEERDRDLMNTYEVCHSLNINGLALGRLSGTMWVVLGPRREKMENVAKHNIGLQLKFPRGNEERVGYCSRSGYQWFYSSLAVELMRDYCQRFPEVVAFFASSNDRCEYVFEGDIFPDAIGQHRIEDVANWVRQQPHMKVERISCGSKTVCRETVELLISAVDELRSLPVKEVKLQVKPHLLVKPNVTLPDVYRYRRSVRLFARVIVVRSIYMVPVGIKGTVIGIYPVTDPNPVRLECVHAVDTFCEVLFDKAVPNFNDIHGIAQDRVYKVPENALVVIYTNEQGQKQNDIVQPERASQKHKASGENVRTNVQKPQSTNSSRYVTAAGSDWVPITMKSQVSDGFVKALGDSKTKPEKSKPVQQQQTPEQMANWRDRPSTSSGKSQQASNNWRKNTSRQQGGSSALDPANAAPTAIVNATTIETTTSTATPQAQTLALMSLLGVKNQDQGSSQPQESIQQQRPTQLQQAPIPGQMPNLPKPPLFWQQEAQKQQHVQAQQTDRIKNQQWYRSPQSGADMDHHPGGGHQRRQQQQRMHHTDVPRSVFNNGNQSHASSTIADQIAFNNNVRMPPQFRQPYQPYQQQQQLYQSNFQTPTETNNVTTRYSSIQDFVPIQAYRPKKSNRAQPGGRDLNAQSLNETTVRNSTCSLPKRSPNEQTVELMQALSIQPSTSQTDSDGSLSTRTNESLASSSSQIKPRKQRVPRIGAKFDLDYIMH